MTSNDQPAGPAAEERAAAAAMLQLIGVGWPYGIIEGLVP
jgi:hypothetical protein